MLGTIILPLIIIAASAADLPPERLDSGYCDSGAALPCVPNACRATFCEEYDLQPDGSLLCLDTDEVYGRGHWAYDIGPDQGDLQVVVEF